MISKGSNIVKKQQSRLDNKNQELLDLKETPKKGFWCRLFG